MVPRSVHRIVNATRYLIVLPSVITLLGAGALTLVGTYEAVHGVLEWLHDPADAKHIMLALIEATDAFLLATVLIVVALGLWELFVDDTVPLPHWLEIHTLDDLKSKLISVVITVLGVLFLGAVIEAKAGSLELLYTGGAIAAVIFALAFFLRGSHGPSEDAEQPTETGARH